MIGPGVGPQGELPSGRGELQAIAHQVVEHLQQQIPVAPNPRQLGFAHQLQSHPLLLGIEPIGAQGLLHRHLHLHRLQLPFPVGFQPREIQHIIDEPGETIGFGISDAQKLLLLLLAQLVAQVVESFHIALDIEQGRAQFMGHVADEPALGGIELHLPGEILNRHGDALEAFATGIAHRLQHDPQRARRIPHAAAQIR